MDISGSVALVTGANGGLGTEFVRQLLERGAVKVYAGARRPAEWNDERVVHLDLDVTDPAAIEAAAKAASDVSLLVNNAGVTGPRSLLTDSLEEIRQTYETNVFGPLALVRAFAPTLQQAGGGAIVNVHSVLSWLAVPGAYSPSKSAFWGLTNSLRIELAAQGTQVVGAHLGYTDTPMTAGLDVPKADPADIVEHILDALASGAEEAHADETAVNVRAALSTITTGAFAPAL